MAFNRGAATRDYDQAQENLSDIQRLRAEARGLAQSIERKAKIQEADASEHLSDAASQLLDWCNDSLYLAECAAEEAVQRLAPRRAA